MPNKSALGVIFLSPRLPLWHPWAHLGAFWMVKERTRAPHDRNDKISLLILLESLKLHIIIIHTYMTRIKELI